MPILEPPLFSENRDIEWLEYRECLEEETWEHRRLEAWLEPNAPDWPITIRCSPLNPPLGRTGRSKT
jgi:hypothetical protein